MGRYIKAQSIQGHYGETDPNCSICHGTGWEHPIANDPDFKLPCHCRMNHMTFDPPEDILMEVSVEPTPDGGARVSMHDVEIGKN